LSYDIIIILFGITTCPPSFVVIALIFSELRRRAESPPPLNPVPEDEKSWSE